MIYTAIYTIHGRASTLLRVAAAADLNQTGAGSIQPFDGHDMEFAMPRSHASLTLPMPLRRAVVAGAALLMTSLAALAQDAVDRISVPGPVAFDGKSYELAWSAQPQPNYYKQEYVPAGEAPQTYSSMVLVEVLTSGAGVKEALGGQAQMLNDRKPNDPLVNFSVLQNEQTGEAILDFIMSSKDDKGEYVVEWNAYRYVPRQPEGVMLFGVSHRAYGNEAAREFLTKLRDMRPGQIDKVARQELPKAEPVR